MFFYSLTSGSSSTLKYLPNVFIFHRKKEIFQIRRFHLRTGVLYGFILDEFRSWQGNFAPGEQVRVAD
jgi:hypothetical protein